MESSADALEQDGHSRATSLEDLPIEIKVMILSHTPHLSCLSNLVHASPAYHQAYRGAREEVLHAITVRTLQEHDVGLLDPWTAVHTLQPGHHVPCRFEIIKESLEKYARGCMDGSRPRLTLEDSLAILSLHKKFSVLIFKYCEDKLSRNPLTRTSDTDPIPPSQLELHRLYRAFWRYEIYSKFFGPLGMGGIVPNSNTFGEEEIASNFLGLFPIYEVEELACLHRYARDFYYDLPAKDCHDSVSGEVQLATQGPQRLYEVMTQIENGRDTSMAKHKNAEHVYVTMGAALDAYETNIRLGSPQWKEIYAGIHSERTPTTGWLWATSDGVQNTDFRLRSWGYVFWDQQRLVHWGITEYEMGNWPRLPCLHFANLWLEGRLL